jgi:16S rRNA C1402 N4-methylase RsmH
MDVRASLDMQLDQAERGFPPSASAGRSDMRMGQSGPTAAM